MKSVFLVFWVAPLGHYAHEKGKVFLFLEPEALDSKRKYLT